MYVKLVYIGAVVGHLPQAFKRHNYYISLFTIYHSCKIKKARPVFTEQALVDFSQQKLVHTIVAVYVFYDGTI